jgi:Periplasmic protein involved in polysaccharide export
MFSKLKIIVFALFLTFIAACSPRTNLKENSFNYDAEEIAKELQELKGSSEYLLQAGDLVDIQVYKEDDMSRTLRISTQGYISFPLIGNIKISDLTVSQAANQIEERLKSYLKNPSVSLLIKEYANKNVYVLGEVKKPSPITIPPEKIMTVLEAITSAGGFTDVAAISKVKVFRIENGQQRSLEVDITQITKEGNKQMDIALKPGDVVFVPQSLF